MKWETIKEQIQEIILNNKVEFLKLIKFNLLMVISILVILHPLQVILDLWVNLLLKHS